MENQTKIQVNLIEGSVQKLTLESGDKLMVTLKGDADLMSQDNFDSLNQALKARFPDNQVMVFFLPDGATLDLAVVKELTQKEKQENSCNSAAYCANCNCGKKQAALNELPDEE